MVGVGVGVTLCVGLGVGLGVGVGESILCSQVGAAVLLSSIVTFPAVVNNPPTIADDELTVIFPSVKTFP
ncbi:MAG: hypothetical protein WDN07_00935 [Actinomycetota bacterium]